MTPRVAPMREPDAVDARGALRARRAAAVAALVLAAASSPAVPADAASSASSAASSAASSPAEESSPPSEAEKLLFMAPQLASLHEPVKLAYDYEADDGGQHTADHVTLTLSPRGSGTCCTTHVDYRSGVAAIARTDLDEPGSNPVLLYFLVEQVQTIARATKGQPTHFQRRIRQALADEAKIQDTTVRWQGKDVPAHAIHIAPFMNDPYRVRYERQSHYEYDFVLSDAVPGGIVRLSATLPAEKDGGAPQFQHTLSLLDPQPAAPARK